MVPPSAFAYRLSPKLRLIPASAALLVALGGFGGHAAFAWSVTWSGGPNFTYSGSQQSVSGTVTGTSYPNNFPGSTSGTWSATAVGNYTATYNASDGYGPYNYTWSIAKASQSTVSISASPTSVYPGGTSTVSASGGTGTGGYVYSIQSGPGAISGTTITATGVGTIVVQVYRATDANYSQSNTATVSIAANAIPTTFTVTPTSFTYTSGAQGPTVTTSPSNATWSYGQGTPSATNAGTYFLTASANGNYTGTTGSASWVINRASEATVAASASPTTIYPGQTSSISVTGGSGTGAYVYSIQSGPGTLSGTTVTATGVGNIVVWVYKAADSNYNQSNTAIATINVIPIPTTFMVSPTTFTYTGAAQGPAITPNPSAATWSVTAGSTSATAAGSYSVTATTTTGGNYSGTSGAVTWTIGQASQAAVSISASSNSIQFGGTGTVTASGGSGTGGYVYSIQSGPGTLSGTTVTATATGTIVVGAYRAADANYVQSATTTVAITVNPIPVTFTVSPTSFIYTGGAQGPNITTSPGGATWSYTGGTPSASAVGSYSVTATANGNYTGTSGAITWTIAQTGSAAPSLSPGNESVAAGAAVTFTASGSTTGAYNWGGTAGASGSGSTQSVAFPNVGSFTVSVQDPGDANHNASSWTTVTITVTPIAPPTVAISPVSSTIVVGQSVSFAASGGANGYVWGGSASGGGATTSVTFSSAGPYTVTVSSPAGGNYTASNTATATITVNLPYIDPGLKVLVPAP